MIQNRDLTTNNAGSSKKEDRTIIWNYCRSLRDLQNVTCLFNETGFVYI